jgi:hypothetical protein
MPTGQRASATGQYLCLVTPLVGAVLGATLLDAPLWAGAFVGGALVIGAVALELRGR